MDLIWGGESDDICRDRCLVHDHVHRCLTGTSQRCRQDIVPALPRAQQCKHGWPQTAECMSPCIAGVILTCSPLVSSSGSILHFAGWISVLVAILRSTIGTSSILKFTVEDARSHIALVTTPTVPNSAERVTGHQTHLTSVHWKLC